MQSDIGNCGAGKLFYLVEGLVCAEKTADIKPVVYITQT